MKERILLCKPKMCGRELDFIKPALAEDWAVPMGPDVTAFEKELGTVIGADNVVALESGTSAPNSKTKCESRAVSPLWKPMHKQPVYKGASTYTNGVSESLFKVGICLPAGPYVTDDDVLYIVYSIKSSII